MGKRDLPTGTVTFLFTDVEGSTKLLHALGADAYADALAEHRRVLREAFARNGGVEVDTQGDAFFVAFPTAPGALAAAQEATAALAEGPIRVRIGLHTGTPLLTAEGYVGPDVHKGARIAAAGHGGQILVSAATAALLEHAELRDLGAHRLKDLSAPERILQADPDEHPPLKTLHQTNLPVQLDAFVGREREVAHVRSLLSGSARLVTVTGPGGTGKTRLALAAAAEAVGQFDGGVFWVPLAAVRDSSLVGDEVANALGSRTDAAEAIGDRAMLLVLDNLEQIIDTGAYVSRLVARCPNLRILATSREPLRVRGEDEFALPPLSEPDAVALFAERSGRAPDAEVAELCRRLDNLPLAVELAAARARVLSPAQMLDRLASRLDLLRGGRDADPRQATLRATIDWSHELLAPEERRVFAALAAFRGGWTLDAAETVADADVETLQSLVEKSLIVSDGARFRMLETIRTYAGERLHAAGADRVHEKHAAYYAAWAERRYAERFAAEDTWLPELTAETDNLRAALEWMAKHDETGAVRLAGAVAPLWMTSGRAGEARGWLAATLPRHAGRDAVRARALAGLGALDDDLAVLGEALDLWRELGDLDEEAATLESTGWVHDALGQYDSAAAAHEASLELRRRAGSPEVRALPARAGLCHVLVATGRSADARVAARELLAASRRTDATYMQQLALHFLADADLVDEDWTAAEVGYRAALAFAAEHDLIGRVTDEMIGVAMAMAESGRESQASRIAAVARAKQAEIGKGTDAWWLSMQDRHLSTASPPSRGAGAPHLPEGDFDAVLAELVA